MDTSALETAYRQLLELAAAGGFRPPADTAAWTAEQHLAHIAATDRLLAATTVEVLGGRPTSYDNTPALSLGYLATIGRAAGDHERLVATVRQTGLELVLLARQLDDERGATAVPTRILEGEVVKVEAPLPWIATLKTHAEVHLPEQIAALRALRGSTPPPGSPGSEQAAGQASGGPASQSSGQAAGQPSDQPAGQPSGQAANGASDARSGQPSSGASGAPSGQPPRQSGRPQQQGADAPPPLAPPEG